MNIERKINLRFSFPSCFEFFLRSRVSLFSLLFLLVLRLIFYFFISGLLFLLIYLSSLLKNKKKTSNVNNVKKTEKKVIFFFIFFHDELHPSCDIKGIFTFFFLFKNNRFFYSHDSSIQGLKIIQQNDNIFSSRKECQNEFSVFVLNTWWDENFVVVPETKREKIEKIIPFLCSSSKCSFHPLFSENESTILGITSSSFRLSFHFVYFLRRLQFFFIRFERVF